MWYDLPVDARDHPFLQHDGPIAFAHRGGAATLHAGRVVAHKSSATGTHDWGENTMAAFQRALDMGFRYLETDVHATRDGVLLAFHDRDLARLTGAQARVGDLTFDELRRLKVTGLHAIPPLAEVLAAFPDTFLNVDVKAGHAIGPAADRPFLLDLGCAWPRSRTGVCARCGQRPGLAWPPPWGPERWPPSGWPPSIRTADWTPGSPAAPPAFRSR